MTEFRGLYTAVVEAGPKEIEQGIASIPDIHRQEALDNALEKSVSLSVNPQVQNVRFLLKLGADPNGPTDEKGVVLSYAYSAGLYHIVELLLQAGADVNATHSNVLEQAVLKKDIKYVIRFVEAGGDVKDKTRLLFNDNLLAAADGDPEIQGYLLSKGANDNFDIEKIKVKIRKMSDFDYPDPGYTCKQEHEVTNDELHIEDYSSRYFLVRGNTKDHQKLFRRNGGRHISKGWIIPISRRAGVEAELLADLVATKLIAESSMSASPAIISPEDLASPHFLIENIVVDTSITRPVIKKDKSVDLYTSVGKYGYMTLSFVHPNLFYLDGGYWDSVERYMMYKTYEGSFKGKAIKEADDLIDACRKFNVNTVSAAKTPRQLVINQKLSPLASSKRNTKYLQHCEQIFYRANKAKFNQNKIYRNKLISGDLEIINRNTRDNFGYEGNLLGNTLMKLRDEFGGASYDHRDVRKTNSLIIERYSGNKKFHVIRGDPTSELATEIRRIGTYKTKTKRVIRGKLYLNLQGGAGWLIPNGKYIEASKLVFNTYPDEKKIEVSGRDWVEKRMQQFVQVAMVFSRFRGKPEIGPDDVLFSIKDVFGSEEFTGEKQAPSDNFTRSVWRYVQDQDAIISDAAIQLLWDFLSKMVLEFTHGVETFDQMKDIMNKIEASVLEMSIKPVEGLTERESIIVHSFDRLYRLLKKISGSEAKICVTVVHIMLGEDYYQKIRELYASKTKMQSGGGSDEESQFRKRFHIKTPHIQAVLQGLPKDLSKKCKLLLLTSLDYIMELDSDDAITISKRLITLSQKGKQPSPSPVVVEEYSDIPRPLLEEEDAGVSSQTPPFDGTPKDVETPDID